MLGTVTRGDEKFTAGGVVYEFLFPTRGGGLGLSSANPFPQKTVTGERSYADYDVLSALALADLSGGMGQDRLVDTAKYFDAFNADARGERVILGPQATATTEYGLEDNDWLTFWSLDVQSGTAYLDYDYVDTSGTTKAARFTTGADVTLIDRVWLPLMGLVSAGTITVMIYTNTGSLPNALLTWDAGAKTASTTLDNTQLRPAGGWVQAVFPDQVPVSASTIYWVVVTHSGATGSLGWYGANGTAAGAASNAARWTGAAWEAATWWHIFWLDNPTVRPDAPLHFLQGAGEDGIERLWGYAGKYLYYIAANGTPTVVVTSAGDPTAHRVGADITDALFFQGSGDTYPFLYLALGDDTNLVKFDCNIGTEQWADVTAGKHARLLEEHDGILWRVDEDIVLDGTLVGDWSEAGASCKVGDLTYPVRRLISWQGDLYAGKDNGLWKMQYTVGYPIATTIVTPTKQFGLTGLESARNFTACVEHQSDLYFNVAQGILRYTIGGVLTSVTPTTGLNLSSSQRREYLGLFSSFNTLWATAEAAIGPDNPGTIYTNGELSSVLAYAEGAWHPIVTHPREIDMGRAVWLEPGLYGHTPRLYFNRGLQVAYVQMPVSTRKRWLVDNQDYGLKGYLYSSWFDGNLYTVEKDWIEAEVDAEGCSANVYAGVSWRSEDTDWVGLTGTVTSDGITTLTFPTTSHSAKCQLRLELYRTDSGTYELSTPIIRALVLKYMERPQDIQAFTRTYEWSTRQTWRNGQPVQLSYGAWLTQWATLRNLAEPFTFTHVSGNTYTCHVVDYAVTEAIEERGDLKDELTAQVLVRLQVI